MKVFTNTLLDLALTYSVLAKDDSFDWGILDSLFIALPSQFGTANLQVAHSNLHLNMC